MNMEQEGKARLGGQEGDQPGMQEFDFPASQATFCTKVPSETTLPLGHVVGEETEGASLSLRGLDCLTRSRVYKKKKPILCMKRKQLRYEKLRNGSGAERCRSDPSPHHIVKEPHPRVWLGLSLLMDH